MLSKEPVISIPTINEDDVFISSSNIVCNTVTKNPTSSKPNTPPLSFSKISSSNEAFGDSACTKAMLLPIRQLHLINDPTGVGGINLHTASGDTITSIDKGTFALGTENLSVDVFDDKDLMHAVVGLAPLANLDYTISLDKHRMIVSKDGQQLINAPKLPTDLLWKINLDNLVDNSSSVPVQHPPHLPDDYVFLSIHHSGNADFAKFVSSAMGSPPDSTLLKALRKRYVIWPHFNSSMLAKNPTNLMATHKGHLDAIPSYIQSSTKQKRNKKRKEARVKAHAVDKLLSQIKSESADSPPQVITEKISAASDFVTSPDDIRRIKVEDAYRDLTGKYLPYSSILSSAIQAGLTMLVEDSDSHTDDDIDNGDIIFTKMSPFEELEEEIKLKIMAQSDATGKYPTPSQARNNYVLITVYKNYIKYTAFQSRSAQDYVKAFDEMITFFKLHGHSISIIRMDNETSSLLEDYFNKNDITPEYVAPGDHRTLLAERAIRTAKNHIISILSGADEDFPQSLWDEALPYAEITLNLLRGFFSDNSISAYQGIIGHAFDISSTPLCVFGTKALAFNAPNERGSWDHHGTPVFYLGPSIQHYRTHRVYVPKTRSRDALNNNLAFYHRKLLLPGASLGDRFEASIRDLAITLQQIGEGNLLQQDDRVPFRNTSSSLLDGLKSLAAMFVKPPPKKDEEAVQLQRVVAPVPPPAAAVSADDANFLPPEDPHAPQPWQRQSARIKDINARQSVNSVVEDQRVVTGTIPIDSVHDSQLYIDGECVHKPHFIMSAMDTLTASNLSPQPSRGPSEDFLNLDDHGHPLTYHSALADPDRHDDFAAAGEHEWIKFLELRECMHAIYYAAIPYERRGDVTYLSHQVKEKIEPFKKEYQAKVRICIGGDKTNFSGDTASHVAAMPAVKILLNSVVSTPGAKFFTIDIVDFYLMTPLDRPEFVKISASKIPASIIKRFDLEQFIDDKGFIYFECTKTVWGLPQAGLISQTALVKALAANGYVMCPNTHGLFTHNTRRTQFSLVVDDFGIKYFGQDDIDHLSSTLKSAGYDIKVNLAGDKYLGFTIKHDIDKRELRISMPKYVPKGLNRFCPDGVPRFAGSAILYTPPKYGDKGEKFAFVDTSSPVSDTIKQWIQEVNGYFSYYSIALDSTFRFACQQIATTQSAPTTRTHDQTIRLLGYAAAHPDAEIVFRASDMELKFHCDGSHNSQPEGKGIAGGYFYLGDKDDPMRLNGAIDVLCKTIPVVTASAGETEYATIFMSAQTACPLRATLEDLHHIQPPTIGIVDNAFAVGLCNDSIKAKRSKSIDLRFHWVRDRVRQGQFNIMWRKGMDNVADFFTKAQPVHRHKEFEQLFLHRPLIINKQTSRSQAWKQRDTGATIPIGT